MNMFDKAGPVKYSVDMSFRGYDDKTSKVGQFYQALAALDEHMIQQGVKNCQQWFKSPNLTVDIVRAFYTPIVRFSKDANGNPKPYPPTLKISLRKKNGSDAFDVQAYDSNKQPYQGVPLEELLVKGAQLTTLIQCTGLWFAGSKFGLSWKAVQIRVDKLPDSIRGFAFADEEGAAVVHAPVARRAAPAPVQQQEVDDDEVFDEAPAPAPVQRQSVLAAVTQPQTLDEEAEDAEPIAVPKKAVMTKKKIVALPGKK
jgi:hypothetical protein